MDKNTIIEFHKRFANGEQYLYLTRTGEIEEQSKSYYWQERGIYNHILPFIETITQKYGQQTDEFLYGKNGVVARLIPIQRAYNNIKNRKHEYLNRLATGILLVEDGSVDIDNLEQEGLAPGKVIIYRQGSNAPILIEQKSLSQDFNSEEDKLLAEFSHQYDTVTLGLKEKEV